MRLEKIDILNFKNIAQAELRFSPGMNALLGMNGMGKSNLLEAVHFLSMARAMSSMPEKALIRHGQDMMMVKGDYTLDSGATWQVSCGIIAGKGKTLKCNGKEYDRISSHIGRIPIVCVIPSDIQILTGSAEQRRRLMDMVISQADESYLSDLIRYNRALESRNRMLRAGVRDALLYESVENTMTESATRINRTRADWTESLSPVFSRYYKAVASGAETATLSYTSQLNGASLTDVLESRRSRDLALGYTSAGTHRDDLETGLDGYSMRQLGSQGQIKTFMIALKLAVFSFLSRHNGNKPLLLLDDIFDRLDAARVERIMQTVTTDPEFGQIFITDTNRRHLDDIVRGVGGEYSMTEVCDGIFKTITPPAF